MGLFYSTLRTDGDYDPSSFTLWFGTSPKTTYVKQEYKQTYQGSAKILVVCTDDGRMEMSNGKIFSTGNHPVEMLVPMLHFRDAGFTFDIATSTGSAVVLEMWAFPNEDEHVKELYDQLKPMMNAPKKLQDIQSLDEYTAIFIPGGHGCMINLPSSVALGNLLHQAHEKGLPTVTLCHGPAALLSTTTENKSFAYEGYEAMCFTDRTDGFTPTLGYLPGPMPWKCQETVEKKGLKVLNTSERGDTTVDRELITGDSPDAAHSLGVVAAPLLVEYAIKHHS
eukprot:Awhi_evm1s12596